MKEFILKYWIQVGFGGIITFVGYSTKKIVGRFKQEHAEQRLLKEALLALLHDRLYQACQVQIDRGYITVMELDNLDYLYKSYHDLGGNGTGTELYNRCRNLPFKCVPPVEK